MKQGRSERFWASTAAQRRRSPRSLAFGPLRSGSTGLSKPAPSVKCRRKRRGGVYAGDEISPAHLREAMQRGRGLAGESACPEMRWRKATDHKRRWSVLPSLPVLLPDTDDGVAAVVFGLVLGVLIPPGEAGVAVGRKGRIGSYLGFEFLGEIGIVGHGLARDGFGEVFAYGRRCGARSRCGASAPGRSAAPATTTSATPASAATTAAFKDRVHQTPAREGIGRLRFERGEDQAG